MQTRDQSVMAEHGRDDRQVEHGDGHGAHGGHGDHAAMFRDKFWLSLLLTIPVWWSTATWCSI